MYKTLEGARKLLGFTQAELAKKIGKTQNYYTLIETGRAKSAPVLKEISQILKIKEGFLSGEQEFFFPFEYPFLTNFYIFYLKERDTSAYEFILNFICRPSKLIDIVFLLLRFPEKSKSKHTAGKRPVMFMTLRDDRNTVFLFKRPGNLDLSETMAIAYVGRPTEIREYPVVKKGTVPLDAELFLDELYELSRPLIFEKSVNISIELAKKIQDGRATRLDILKLFPGPDYFKKQYEEHLNLNQKEHPDKVKSYTNKTKR